MKNMTKEEIFLEAVGRINRYLILLGIFFLMYFLLRTKADIYLFLLALSNMAFALLSHKHIQITNKLAFELARAKRAINNMTAETRAMHDNP